MKCEFCGNPLSDAQYLLLKNVVYKSCPGCSVENNQHVHYLCPEAFGTTPKRITSNNPMGLQSHCAKCRSGKKGPHEDAFLCSNVKATEGHIIREIRFLPMSKSVVPDIEQFITITMPNRGGTYYYKSKMNCPSNTLVLFQYDAKIVGYAVYSDLVELSNPLTIDGEEYSGYYQFEPNTITFLHKPITKEDIISIDPTFKAFGQSAQKRPLGLLPAIFTLIKKGGKVTTPSFEIPLPEELEQEMSGTIVEGAKKQIVVNAYERSSHARIACINHYRKKNDGRLRCEICGFDFGKVYGDEFEEKIHIHHLVEVSSIGSEYEVNPIKDLIPICPNCHMIAHGKKPAYTPEEIKEMLKKHSL